MCWCIVLVHRAGASCWCIVLVHGASALVHRADAWCRWGHPLQRIRFLCIVSFVGFVLGAVPNTEPTAVIPNVDRLFHPKAPAADIVSFVSSLSRPSVFSGL